MVTITIKEKADNNTELVCLLRYIASLIEKGYTVGFGPSWFINGEEILPEEDN